MDDHHEHPLHNRGLAFDMDTLLGRRRLLGLFAGLGAVTLVGCADGSSPTAGSTTSAAGATSTVGATSTATASASATAVAADCDTAIPRETAGPYPGDGSNGPNVLTQSGIVRGDIRSSFGGSSTVAKGVPLTINLTILNMSNGCKPYQGAAIYLWHCDIEGRYSMYSQGVTNENYLRGVQVANAQGVVTFTSIFPAAYSGRWPHIHFEVYPSLANATSAGAKVTTSQLALPKAVCQTVYATSGYEQSVRNLAQTSLENDNVFGDDDGVHQLATVSGSVSAGYVASLAVPV